MWKRAIINEIKLQPYLFHCIFLSKDHPVNVEAHNLGRFSLSLGLGRNVCFGKCHDPNSIPHSMVFDV